MNSNNANDRPRSRRLRRRQLLITATVGGVSLTGLAAIGCGGSNSKSTSSNGSASGGATASGTQVRVGGGTPSLSSGGAATQAAVAGAGKPGGTLNVAAFADVNSLDPHTPTADDLSLRSTSLFEGLATQDESLKYGPSLAESWQASPDAVEWTFKLRSGIKFHDGTACDAAAVKANIERVNDPKNALTARTLLVFYKDSQVIDPLTIKITHSQPDGAALANIGGLAIVSPTAFTSMPAKDFGQKPVGTGPFKFKEWAPDDHITVTRFEDYWGGKAKLDAINFKIIADENTRLTAVRTGEIDFVPRISLPLLTSLQSDKSVQVVETIPVFRTYFGIGN
ncbi:MAG: ABC transporter substrate-binding protein, partial [Dehalococcoidia bacterium]